MIFDYNSFWWTQRPLYGFTKFPSIEMERKGETVNVMWFGGFMDMAFKMNQYEEKENLIIEDSSPDIDDIVIVGSFIKSKINYSGSTWGDGEDSEALEAFESFCRIANVNKEPHFKEMLENLLKLK